MAELKSLIVSGTTTLKDSLIFAGSVGGHSGVYLTYDSSINTLFINGSGNTCLEVSGENDPFVRKGASTRHDYTIIHAGNYTSYCAAASHTHTKSQITDFPSSLPASDVYSWAKASTKPSYTLDEVSDGSSRILFPFYKHTNSDGSTAAGEWDANSLSDGWHNFKCYVANAGTTVNHGSLFQNSFNGTPFQIWIPDVGYYIYKRYNTSTIGGTWSKIYAGYADSAGSAPASDVYAWAKASTKPSYTYSEVGAAAASHTHSYLPLAGGTLTGTLTMGTNAIIFYGSVGATTGSYAIYDSSADTLFINGHGRVRLETSSACPGVRINGSDYDIIHTGNYTSYCAAASHTHAYLPLAGGSMTGTLTVPWSGLVIGSDGGDSFAYRAIKAYTTVGTDIYINLGYAPSAGNCAEVGFHYSGTGSSSNRMTLGFYDSQIVNILYGGAVGIGTASPSYTLQVAGNVGASGGFYDTSDARLKNFKSDLSIDFDKLKSIPKKYFTWKDTTKDDKLHIGTSAQEIQKVFPEVVNEGNDGILTVDYSKLAIVALAAIDELKKEIDELKKGR